MLDMLVKTTSCGIGSNHTNNKPPCPRMRGSSYLHMPKTRHNLNNYSHVWCWSTCALMMSIISHIITTWTITTCLSWFAKSMHAYICKHVMQTKLACQCCSQSTHQCIHGGGVYKLQKEALMLTCQTSLGRSLTYCVRGLMVAKLIATLHESAAWQQSRDGKGWHRV